MTATELGQIFYGLHPGELIQDPNPIVPVYKGLTYNEVIELDDNVKAIKLVTTYEDEGCQIEIILKNPVINENYQHELDTLEARKQAYEKQLALYCRVRDIFYRKSREEYNKRQEEWKKQYTPSKALWPDSSIGGLSGVMSEPPLLICSGMTPKPDKDIL
jgi:hypothetical protein